MDFDGTLILGYILERKLHAKSHIAISDALRSQSTAIHQFLSLVAQSKRIGKLFKNQSLHILNQLFRRHMLYEGFA
jgi:hypothetical protein